MVAIQMGLSLLLYREKTLSFLRMIYIYIYIFLLIRAKHIYSFFFLMQGSNWQNSSTWS